MLINEHLCSIELQLVTNCCYTDKQQSTAGVEINRAGVEIKQDLISNRRTLISNRILCNQSILE